MTEPVSVLLIFVNEEDRWGDGSLHEAIVARLCELGMAGVATQSALTGQQYARQGRALFGLASERPVMVTVVDETVRIRAIIPEVRLLLQEGLMLLARAELLLDGTVH